MSHRCLLGHPTNIQSVIEIQSRLISVFFSVPQLLKLILCQKSFLNWNSFSTVFRIIPLISPSCYTFTTASLIRWNLCIIRMKQAEYQYIYIYIHLCFGMIKLAINFKTFQLKKASCCVIHLLWKTKVSLNAIYLKFTKVTRVP